MKTINQIRSTNSFHILSERLDDLIAIREHFGRTLISVAFDARTEEYTVRVSLVDKLDDVRFTLDALSRVTELERRTIMTFEGEAA